MGVTGRPKRSSSLRSPSDWHRLLLRVAQPRPTTGFHAIRTGISFKVIEGQLRK